MVVGEALSHVIQHILRESLGLRMRQILSQPPGIQAHLVHADQADGGKMVIKAAKITLCIGIEPR